MFQPHFPSKLQGRASMRIVQTTRSTLYNCCSKKSNSELCKYIPDCSFALFHNLSRPAWSAGEPLLRVAAREAIEAIAYIRSCDLIRISHSSLASQRVGVLALLHTLLYFSKIMMRGVRMNQTNLPSICHCTCMSSLS